MTLTRAEAQDTLRAISHTEHRSSAAYGYQMSAPHLILWGVIWVIGYGFSYWQPERSQIWLALVAGGVLGSMIIGRRMRPPAAGSRDWRYLATVAALAIFITVLFVILTPRGPRGAGAFFPVLAAFYYSLIGIWTRGSRMTVLGVALVVLTLSGFVFPPQFFTLWMAIVGGGGLILGGLWLRSV